MCVCVQIPPLHECQKLGALRHLGGETRFVKTGGKSRKLLGKTILYQTLPVWDYSLPLLFLFKFGPWDPGPWTCFSLSILASPFWFPTELFLSQSQQFQFGFLEFTFKYFLSSSYENTNCDLTTWLSSTSNTTD